jgi:hypothetical protein
LTRCVVLEDFKMFGSHARTLVRSGVVGALVAMLSASLFNGCSSDEEQGDPKQNQDASVDSSIDVQEDCRLVGVSCSEHGQCCSANCDPTLNACVKVGQCKDPGESCSAGNECCTFVCDGGKCGSKACTSDNQACTDDSQCCSARCVAGDGGKRCEPLNPACKTSGNDCGTHADCCSKFCQNGRCSSQPSFCTQTGDACSADNECCVGLCKKQDGAVLGLCSQPGAPGTTGCLAAGEVCGGGAAGDAGLSDAGVPLCGGECCSRACAPWGPTGVLVCQPPSGCRPTGEICLADSDCCGSPGLPGGNGSVRCSKSAGEPVGRCDNGTACRPSGAVCKLATGSCNAENNCCAGNVNVDPSVCQQDSLGIPRCTEIDCADGGSLAGQPCATSADCCGLPCLPNKNAGEGGSLYICGDSCVPSGGACTTDSDCCAGLPCKAPPGSTQGTCGETIIPDAGTDAGTCALYGQDCTTDSDCCNEVPCSNGKCLFVVK